MVTHQKMNISLKERGKVSNTKEDTLISITGLWKRQDKNGNEYLCGNFSECEVFIFATKKSKPNHPDYVMKFGKKIKKEAPKDELPDEGVVPF